MLQMARAAKVEAGILYRVARMESIRMAQFERITGALDHEVVLTRISIAQLPVADRGQGGALAQLRRAAEERCADRPKLALCRDARVTHPVLYRLLRGEAIRVVCAERIVGALGLEFAIVPMSKPA